jgi:hypothetical protein
MDINWNIITLIIALLALWVAYADYRRNNFTIIRLRDCTCSYTQSIDENACQTFCHFRIIIQNLGIPLHDVHMSLSFSGKDGSGRLNLPLKASEQITVPGQFAKGMIAAFSLKSHQLDKGGVAFLTALEDAKKQAASLCLYSDGFLVWECRLDSFWIPVQRFWNRLAGKVNYLIKTRKGTNAEGVPIVKYYTLLPKFIVPSQRVLELARYMRKPQ